MLKVVNLLQKPRFFLPSTCQLLAEGGDDRIVLDPLGRVNKYGARPTPDPGLAAFGSSTVSTISVDGFAAADALRIRLLLASNRETPAEIYLREIGRIRSELIHMCGLSEIGGLEAIFSPSGTELHTIAARLLARGGAARTLAIMVHPAETGGRVKNALAGQVRPQAPAARGGHLIDVTTVAIRAADGSPRPSETVDSEVEALVSAAVGRYDRILIVVADVSKTGLIAPSPARVLALKARWLGLVEILIDAAQFRIAMASLRGYLTHDCMVALTGSKFLTGPAFSAVLLVPEATAHRLMKNPLDTALGLMSARAEWPQNWPGVEALPQIANCGLLLRWEAALAELRAFRAVPEPYIRRFLEAFSQAIQARLNSDPHFGLLAQPGLDRRPVVTGEHWDQLPTIFPFLLYHVTSWGARVPLTTNETKLIYSIIGENKESATLRYELGQPVLCGNQYGINISALRLCIGARTIVENASNKNMDDDKIIRKALMVLDNVAFLIDKLSKNIH
jgi:hypothetical protein